MHTNPRSLSRRMFRQAALCAAACIVWTAAVHAADWSPVAPGIDYREYVLDGPVHIFAARADRQVKTWTLDTMTSLGEIKGGREAVPGMVNRCNDTITFDGHRYDIKVAVNGDYFDMKSGVALSGQIMSGWFAKRFNDNAGSGLVWTSDRRCFVGGDLLDGPTYQHVTFADGSDMKIDALNTPRDRNSLALYTAQFADNTGTSPDGVEVEIRVEAPVCVSLAPPGNAGRIMRIRRESGSTPLGFDSVVLSAQGRAAAELLRHVNEGDSVQIVLGLRDIGVSQIGLPVGDWQSAYASIGGPKCIVANGKVPRDWEKKAAQYAAQGKKHGSVVQDPRTAIAVSERYVYFLVIDGRSQASRGMTFTEAGNFCRDELKATDATLQDGGGSSVLWLDGKIMNHPSGKPGQDEAGQLRPVANGWFIAEVLEPKRLKRYSAGQSLPKPAGESLRLGPGINHKTVPSAARGGAVTIEGHRLNGIAATQAYWWYCSTKNAKGWLPLAKMSEATSSTTH